MRRRLRRRRPLLRNTFEIEDNYYVNLIANTESLATGSRFSPCEYMSVNIPLDATVSEESLIAFIDENIEKGILNLKKLDSDQPVYEKTGIADTQINLCIGEILKTEENSPFSINDISEYYTEDNQFTVKAQIKEYLENNMEELNVKYLGIIDDEKKWAKYVTEKPTPKYNLLTVLFKCDEIADEVPFVLKDVLGEEPDKATKMLFDMYVYFNQNFNTDMNIKQKGVNPQGEMVYIKTNIKDIL